ncbi:LysR family transcriptional regulator [Vibrio genomosp. F6]|uniref:LysR family transcriptional regulator n=1 Tax=Vibrio TaxID=662 RepID=UPI0010BDF26C|nr:MULTISPECIES: LysR family transcriptional regulator [Vibrio]NOH82603.1 LysR family transcriptional regulator [Vibrio sp. 03-59-1]TKF22049.1 LysR family transcriptional regulator [Vibrio genomosp. F6]
MDKIQCLTVFTRVAFHGTFTAAANELNITQSAVSKKIAWLEKEIGITLFHRHSRAISLTNGGKQYLKLAIKLTEELSTFESQLRQEQTIVSGKLKLSVPSAFSVRLLSSPLNEFMNLNPNLTVDVSVSDKLVNLVEDEIDIAIRASYLKDSGLKAKWLMDNELVYFASVDYLASHPPIMKARDLEQHKCLTYALSNPSNLWRFYDGKEELRIKVHERIRSDNPEMLVKMAKLGQGVTGMPKWMIEKELKSNELKIILDQYQPFKLPMYLLYKDVDHQPQSIRSFIDFLSDYFFRNEKR